MQPQVQTLVDRWVEAFNTGRTDDLAAFYVADARIIPPGRTVVKGADGMRSYFSDIRAQGFRDYTVDINDTFVKDEFLIASGRWGLIGPGSDGAWHRYEGNWLNVLNPGAETWRIVIHMWN